MNRKELGLDKFDRLPVDTHTYWSVDFENAGYHRVDMPGMGRAAWHDWCKHNISPGYWVWTGSTCWFVHESDAMTFSLTWS